MWVALAFATAAGVARPLVAVRDIVVEKREVGARVRGELAGRPCLVQAAQLHGDLVALREQLLEPVARARAHAGQHVERGDVLLLLVLLVSVPAAAQTWQIDSAHSRAQFTVKHLGIANIRGDFGGVTGTVDFDGKDVTKAKVTAVIDVNSITTRVAPPT